MNISLMTAVSGMQAAGTRISVAGSNIANGWAVGSLKISEPGATAPYRVLTVDQTSNVSAGVGAGTAVTVREKSPATLSMYYPEHSAADAEGNVAVPNVSLDEEAVNLIIARTSFMANIKAAKAAISQSRTLLDVLR